MNASPFAHKSIILLVENSHCQRKIIISLLQNRHFQRRIIILNAKTHRLGVDHRRYRQRIDIVAKEPCFVVVVLADHVQLQ